MNNQKKLQVFLSSTYIDLKEERQSAVEAILKAGHIPAGMELFTANNKSQWDVIKRWIDESDIYMLILGGRYGSIEKESGKSYTHLEYEYAQSKTKPLFAVVIDESILGQRRSDSIESVNPKKLEEFRKQVLNKMSSFFKDEKDIKLAVHESLGQLNQDYNLDGWVRGNLQNDDLAKEMVILNERIRELTKENESLKEQEIKRIPELNVKINNGQELSLEFEIDKSIFYKNREAINVIPEHLNDFLSQEEVDEYNQELEKIDDEKIKGYNLCQTKVFSLKNLSFDLKIDVENLGTMKASDIHISITFPDFIILKNKDSIQDDIDSYEKASLEYISSPLYDPLKQAEVEYQKSLIPTNPVLSSSFLNSMIGSSAVRPMHHSMTLHNLNPRLNNPNRNRDFINQNSIEIRLDNLLHGYIKSYSDYVVSPLRKDKGNIKIHLHCEEYLESQIQEIPIVVN